MRLPEPRHQNPQIIVNLRDRAHRASRRMAGVLLLDGHGRRKPLDVLDLRLLHLPDELPGVGAEAFDVAPLALGVDRVHRQRAFSRSARPAANGQPVAGNIDVDVLEVVLRRAADADELSRFDAAAALWPAATRAGARRARSPSSTFLQDLAGVRCETASGFRVASRLTPLDLCVAASPTSSGVPAATTSSAGFAAFGAEVDDPVGRFDDLGVVLDDQHRVAGVDEIVQHLQQQLDVGEVQAGRRLVEQVERPAGAFLDQFAGELHPLGLAAGERGRRLAEFHVIEPHVVQRLQLVLDGRDVLEVLQAPPECPSPALARSTCP